MPSPVLGAVVADPPASASQLPDSNAWRAALPALIALIALILMLYRETATAMVTIWYRSETFTHGFVVFPIALWLVWRRKVELSTLTPRPNPYVLLSIAGLALLWLLGDLVAVNSVAQLALVALLVATVPAVLGLQVARAITFPLAFMFFAVPIGEFIMPQLMDRTADFTILALRLTGIPVYREGLSFVIPSGNWSVVEACSGVRYLIASLTVGTLYAYLNYQTASRRVLFVIVSILVPIVANWFRAYMIVMLGHLSGNTLAVGVDHLIYGWVFFGVVIVLMFVIGARWAEPEPIGVKSVDSTNHLGIARHTVAEFWVVALLAAAIVTMPTLTKHGIESGRSTANPELKLSQDLAGTWRAADATVFDYRPHFQNPSVEINRAFSAADQPVGVYIAYYRDQTYGSKLVSSNNVLATSNDSRWRMVDHGAPSVTLGGKQVQMRSAELRRLGAAAAAAPEQLRALQVYWINGTLTSNDYVAKIYSGLYQLLGKGDESAVIVFFTASDRSDAAQRRLAEFIKVNYGEIDAALRAAGVHRR